MGPRRRVARYRVGAVVEAWWKRGCRQHAGSDLLLDGCRAAMCQPGGEDVLRRVVPPPSCPQPRLPHPRHACKQPCSLSRDGPPVRQAGERPSEEVGPAGRIVEPGAGRAEVAAGGAGAVQLRERGGASFTQFGGEDSLCIPVPSG